MTETVQIPLSYNLKKVKTLADLKTAIGDQELVMYTRLDTHSTLDGRVKNMGDWEKIFVIKVDKDGNIVTYRTISGDFKYFSDITELIYDRFSRRESSKFFTNHNDKYTKGEEELFKLFLYNRKKGNTMYIIPQFIPQNLKDSLQLHLKTASKILSDALDHCKKRATSYKSHKDTLDKKGRYNRIKPTSIAIRNNYPTSFIKYTYKGKSLSFDFDYAKQYTLKPNTQDLRDACTYSGIFNTTNYEYNILTLGKADTKLLNDMLETAAAIHTKIRTDFHTWFQTLPQPTVK